MRTPPFAYKWVVACIFVVGLFMEILDATIVNVALPTLQEEFQVTGSGIEWVVTGYLLSLAVWIPASGWIGDRFGTKRTFLFALALFTFASFLCGQAQSMEQLIAFRILQGVGGGMMTPVGTAMLFRAFPPAERAKASTVLIVPTVLAPALGPVVGGWLVTNHDWRWIFDLNIPLGIAGFVFGALYLQESKEPTAGRFDLPGFVLAGGGLALLLYALSEGPVKGWTSTLVLGTGLTGLAMAVGLVVWELRIRQPMLDLRLLRERMFRNANIVMAFSYGSFVGLLFLLPLLLQGLLGLTAFESGLTTFPQAIGVMISSQLVGRLYPRVGPRRLVVFGLTGVAIVSIGFLFVGPETDLWFIRAVMFLRGVFMAFSFVPIQASSYANISFADTGRASALLSTQRQMAAALGVAVMATLLTSRTTALTSGITDPAELADARLSAFHQSFAVGIVLVGVGAVVGLLIRDVDAAATMRPRGAPHVPQPQPQPAAAGVES